MPAPGAMTTWLVYVFIVNSNIQENSSSTRFLQTFGDLCIIDTMLFPLPLDNSLAYARNSAK